MIYATRYHANPYAERFGADGYFHVYDENEDEVAVFEDEWMAVRVAAALTEGTMTPAEAKRAGLSYFEG